jgi:hypothetical protein
MHTSIVFRWRGAPTADDSFLNVRVAQLVGATPYRSNFTREFTPRETPEYFDPPTHSQVAPVLL